MTIENLKLANEIRYLVKAALSEDLGSGDITACLIDPHTQSKATVICRDNAVIAGIDWFNEVFMQLDIGVKVHWHVKDGDQVDANTLLCELEGRSASLLSGERTALNLLQTLSATATATHEYVEKIAHTQCRILDTRKTIPGLREAQKYAVTCGGGKNHRHGLYDGILIKENHILAAGSIANAVNAAKQQNQNVPVEVEVETLNELQQAIDCGADIALLDNMDETLLKQAVELTQKRIKLEASGGISLDNVASVAETGVDFISIGLITKNINAIDLSMRFQ